MSRSIKTINTYIFNSYKLLLAKKNKIFSKIFFSTALKISNHKKFSLAPLTVLIIILNIHMVYSLNSVTLSNNDADFTIDLDTGLLIQIKDKHNNIEYLQDASGLAYLTNGIWNSNYNVPCLVPSSVISQTDEKIILQKTKNDIILTYTYEIKKNRLDLTIDISYTGKSSINDFEARLIFGFNDTLLKNNYYVSPFIEDDSLKIKNKIYSELSDEYIYTNTAFGGPSYVFLNNSKSGILILLKNPIASSNWGGVISFFWIYNKNNIKLPLVYLLKYIYFDSKNNHKTIKISITLDKNINVAKRKAFDEYSQPPEEILGNWYITFTTNIPQEKIDILKSNNYKIIQLHLWMPNYGIYPTSGTWINFNGEQMSVDKINDFIKKIQDNNMTVFLYFNPSEIQNNIAINYYPDYIMRDKDNNYVKGYWIEDSPYGDKDKLYVMSLRNGTYKTHMLKVLNNILNTYNAKGIFIDRNDYSPMPDYNNNSIKYYFDINTNLSFGVQEYDAFLEEAISMIHSYNKYVIVNMPRSINYIYLADGTAIDSTINYIKFLHTSSLEKPFYILPLQELTPVNYINASEYLRLYDQIKNLLKYPNTYFGTYTPLSNNFEILSINVSINLSTNDFIVNTSINSNLTNNSFDITINITNISFYNISINNSVLLNNSEFSSTSLNDSITNNNYSNNNYTIDEENKLHQENKEYVSNKDIILSSKKEIMSQHTKSSYIFSSKTFYRTLFIVSISTLFVSISFGLFLVIRYKK